MKIVSSPIPLLAAAALTAALFAAPPTPLAAAPQEGDAEASAEERSVPPIVTRAIEHHGGDLYTSTASSFEIASSSGTFRVEVRRNGGVYEQAVESVTQEGRRRVVVTNDSVELLMDGKGRRVSERDAQRWRSHVDARVWFPYLPYGLANDGVYVHDRGVEEWPVAIGPVADEAAGAAGGTRELHKVKVTFQPGSSSGAEDEYLFWFDPETGQLEQLAYFFSGGLRFRVAKSFRRVGGILFADHENYGIDFDEGESRSVDEITPALVQNEMEHISTIELRNIEVQEIE
jgi:hypothetical protein